MAKLLTHKALNADQFREIRCASTNYNDLLVERHKNACVNWVDYNGFKWAGALV